MDFHEWEKEANERERAYFENGGRLVVQAYEPIRGPAFAVYGPVHGPEYTSDFTYETMEQADKAAREHAIECEYDYMDLNNVRIPYEQLVKPE